MVAFLFIRMLSFLQTEGISNNYVDVEQKIMQVRFIIFLCTRRFSRLSDQAALCLKENTSGGGGG